MASSFLGPESPRPLSVISESYRHRFILPAVPATEQHRFGSEYENCMYKLVHKYLDLGTTDKLCYVGDTKGSFAEGIINRYHGSVYNMRVSAPLTPQHTPSSLTKKVVNLLFSDSRYNG